VLLEIPKDIMNFPQMVSTLDRTKITDRQAVGVLSQAFKLGGADLNEFKISKSGAQRKRKLSRKNLAEEAMEDFKAKKPKFSAVHWDGKLVDHIHGSNDERLAILVSGAPDFVEGKTVGCSQAVK
jgi:hypothetical protein